MQVNPLHVNVGGGFGRIAMVTLEDARRSALIVIDVQAKMVDVVSDPEAALAATDLLVVAARRLGIPILLTEQYPNGLGSTIPRITEACPGAPRVEKIHFSAMAEPGGREAIYNLGCEHAVVCGMETHVCVLQTALELRAAGYGVSIAEDACASRCQNNKAVALERMAHAGVRRTTSEMVVFEWLRRADTAAFKDLIKIIK